MRNFSTFILFLFSLSLPLSAYCWGAEGHKLVAEFAFHYLDKQTQENVKSALQGLTIEQASTWMDDMRSDPHYDSIKPYHYVNFDKGLDPNYVEGANIIAVLAHSIHSFDTLSLQSDDEVKLRLCYLFHLMGDLHQPLHVGYGEDKGGNKIQVTINGQGSNLHKVWDSEIINAKHTKLEDLLLPESEVKNMLSLEKMDVLDWTKASRAYLPQVYDFKDNQLTQAYIDANYPIVKHQLQMAGVRLALVLQHYFGNYHLKGNASVPVAQVPLTIKLKKVRKHVGELVQVCGSLEGTHTTKGDKPNVLLNIGRAYPNQILTLIIFHDDISKFPYDPTQLPEGKQVCITGYITLYKGEPEIVLKEAKQLELR